MSEENLISPEKGKRNRNLLVDKEACYSISSCTDTVYNQIVIAIRLTFKDDS